MRLLEREQCLADLAAWLGAIGERGGCIVLVAGEAGIGKTSLLQAFARSRPGQRVLWGACDALFTPQPLAPLNDIARQSTGPLAAATRAGVGRDALFAAALDELDRPDTLVILEDLHWADEATLDLLKFLGRRIQRTRAMIVVTFRDDEVGPQHPLRFVIGDLPRASTHRLALAPLSESAVDVLARQAGRPSKGLHGVTGGNPLFVSEVLAAGSDAVPATVQDAVLARTIRLSPAARELAELVSIVPGKVEPWLLAATAGAQESGLDECLRAGMVRHDDGSLCFRHELVRRALADSLTPARQRSLHARILAALARHADVRAARLAHHANGAHDGPQVLRLAPLAAAQAAALGSHREAAAQLLAALPYAAGLAPLERARLNEGYSYECYLTDQIESAIAARRTALEIWRAAAQRRNEGDALRWLSRLSWFAGHRADADRYAGEAIATLEALAPGPELGMAYSNRAQLDMLAHETESAIGWAGRAIALAESIENREILCHALNNLGTSRILGGDEAGWPDLERSLQIALEDGLQEHVARAYTNLCSTSVSERRYAQASRMLARGLAYSQEKDLDSWRVYMLAWSARARFEQGDWLGAAEDAEGVLSQRRAAPVSRAPALITLAHLRIRRGDPGADAPLEEGAVLAGSIAELQRDGPLALARAEARWLADDLPAAAALLGEVYELAGRSGDRWMKGEIAVWLWRCGGLEALPPCIAQPHELEISGNWQAAAAAWRSLGCPYEHALVLGWYGAEPQQREALAIFAGLGAAPAVEALRRRMRLLGIRGVPRGVRASTQQHPFGLTRREAQILGQMREGLSNAAIARRLFFSTRTVDHHVSAILAKLGAKSRAEALAIAGQQDPAPA